MTSLTALVKGVATLSIHRGTDALAAKASRLASQLRSAAERHAKVAKQVHQELEWLRVVRDRHEAKCDRANRLADSLEEILA